MSGDSFSGFFFVCSGFFGSPMGLSVVRGRRKTGSPRESTLRNRSEATRARAQRGGGSLLGPRESLRQARRTPLPVKLRREPDRRRAELHRWKSFLPPVS